MTRRLGCNRDAVNGIVGGDRLELVFLCSWTRVLASTAGCESREPVRRILAHLGMPTDAPPVARARDPTDDVGDDDAPAQLALGLP